MTARWREHRLGIRQAAVGALVVTVVVGSVSDALFLAAFQFRPDWFADPARLVQGGSGSAELLQWAALTDLCSYYLPTAVVATPRTSQGAPGGRGHGWPTDALACAR
jgi:hypothetical protein